MVKVRRRIGIAVNKVAFTNKSYKTCSFIGVVTETVEDDLVNFFSGVVSYRAIT